MKLIDSIENAIRRTIGLIATAILGWMILLSFVQLILRYLFDIGIPWADVQLRQMVLLIALFGAVLASSQSRHIRIDLLDYLGNRRLRALLLRIVSILSAIAVLSLAYYSIGFIRSESEHVSLLRSFFFGIDTPQWYIELCIPLCLCLMAFFFLILAVKPPEGKKAAGPQS